MVKIAHKLNLKRSILVQVIKCTINYQIPDIEDVRLYLKREQDSITFIYCMNLGQTASNAEYISLKYELLTDVNL